MSVSPPSSESESDFQPHPHSGTQAHGETLVPDQSAVITPIDSIETAGSTTFSSPRQTRRGSGSRLLSAPATYALVGINVGVFLWMLFTGVSFDSTSDLIRFGATSTSLMQQHGQWYRLVTAIFVHGGWIHLATNMWCLWNLGMLGEPLLGPFGLAAVYVLTGAAGNLLSMSLNVAQGNDEVSVGASGAVFGIAGILIVLLSNRRLPIPWDELRRLRRSVVQFAILNLVIGGATLFTRNIIRIDNSAHIGGFLSGLALGAPLVPRMTSGRESYLLRQKITFAVAALVLSLFGYWVASLH